MFMVKHAPYNYLTRIALIILTKMSNVVCFLACKNLYKGFDAFGQTEYRIAKFNMTLQVVCSMLSCLIFIIIKTFFRFKNEKIGDIYNVFSEMFKNNQSIKNFFYVLCANSMAEISTCYLVKKSFETGDKINFKKVVGFLVAQVVVRQGIIHVFKPDLSQFLNSYYIAVAKVESDKETRNERSIVLLLANKNDSQTNNKIKKLPVELIGMVNELL